MELQTDGQTDKIKHIYFQHFGLRYNKTELKHVFNKIIYAMTTGLNHNAVTCVMATDVALPVLIIMPSSSGNGIVSWECTTIKAPAVSDTQLTYSSCIMFTMRCRPETDSQARESLDNTFIKI